MSIVSGNLENVRNRIKQACIRSNRSPADVQLVAVSKTFGPESIREAAAAEQKDFGESYAQEFRSKAELFRTQNLQWHFIGHLQSNKVKYVFDDVCLIHSLDRLSLATELQKRADKADRVVDVLVEVHTTDEATKTGLPPSEVLPFLRSISLYDRVRIKGLMTIGPYSDDPENSRQCFKTVRLLQKQLRQDAPSGMKFDVLSMGMTGDFEVAIDEGATLVRVGTAIFGQRKKHD